MRKIIFFTLTIALFSCSQRNNEDKDLISSNDTNIIVKPAIIDSLIIIDDDFALNPFHTNIDFKYFTERIKSNYTIVDAHEPIFSDNGNDTFKILRWGQSNVKGIPANSKNDFFLISLVICDNNIVLDKDIKIGDSVQSILKKFNVKYDNSKMYKFIQVETNEASYNVIYFFFEDNILTSFEYYPYLG